MTANAKEGQGVVEHTDSTYRNCGRSEKTETFPVERLCGEPNRCVGREDLGKIGYEKVCGVEVERARYDAPETRYKEFGARRGRIGYL